MNKKLKAKWVKALRSGKYRQGYRSLKLKEDLDLEDDRKPETLYCCLGVLRDLMHPKSRAMLNGEEDLLCERHMREAGLTEEQQRHLARMNDDDGKNFKQIAAFIAKTL